MSVAEISLGSATNRMRTGFLLSILLLSLFLRIGVAMRSPNIFWPDEIYQTQEQAHRLAYGQGVVPWEFRFAARSWVLPGFLAGVMRATDWMGSGSDGYLLGIAIVLSMISLTAVWFGFAWGYRIGGLTTAIVAGLACTLWYELIFFAPKALNEMVAGNLLLPGLYLGTYGQERGTKWRLFAAGLFLGMAVALRMQLAPAVLLAAVYFCRKSWKETLIPLMAGLALPVAAFGLVDAFTWSYPFQSYIVNFTYNLVRHKAATFSTEPWYQLPLELIRHEGPIPLIAIYGARRSRVLGWVALAVLIPHSMLSHKEYRFIYPLLPIMITLGAIGATEIITALNARLARPRSAFATVSLSLLFFLGASAALGSLFPRWKTHAGDLIAFRQLSLDPTVCGVGLYKSSWAWSGGYTYLHHDVPIYMLTEGTEMATLAPDFNVVVTSESLPQQQDSFELKECWPPRAPTDVSLPTSVCIYKRTGPCSPDGSQYEVNEVLRRLGQ